MSVYYVRCCLVYIYSMFSSSV